MSCAPASHRGTYRCKRVTYFLPLPDLAALAFFAFAFSDDVSSWRMLPDGSWQRRSTDESGKVLPDLQDLVMADRTEARSRGSR